MVTLAHLAPADSAMLELSKAFIELSPELAFANGALRTHHGVVTFAASVAPTPDTATSTQIATYLAAETGQFRLDSTVVVALHRHNAFSSTSVGPLQLQLGDATDSAGRHGPRIELSTVATMMNPIALHIVTKLASLKSSLATAVGDSANGVLMFTTAETNKKP